MEARHSHEDMMQEGIRQLRDVESYTAVSMNHMRTMQVCVRMGGGELVCVCVCACACPHAHAQC